jgi:hypothetical protein
MFALYVWREQAARPIVQTMQTKLKRGCSLSSIKSPLLPQFSSFLLHTYLLRRPKIKNMGSYFTRPALHSAASSKVWYPSGSQRGQFLIASFMEISFIVIGALRVDMKKVVIVKIVRRCLSVCLIYVSYIYAMY